MYKKRSDIFDSNFVYFLIISCFVIIRIISSTFSISTVLGYFLNTVIQVGLMFCLPMFVYTYLRRQKLKTTLIQYNFKKISIKTILYSILIGILIYFVTIFIATFFSSILSIFGYESASGSSASKEYPLWLLFVELFFTAVMPGVCEEVAHRGMLISTYKRFGIKKSIILTGLLFGLMHLNIEQFFYTSLIGMFLGALVIFSGSIYPAMIIHFMNNAISTFMGFSSANNLPVSTYLNNFISLMFSQGALVGITMIFFTIISLASLIILISTSLIKETRIKFFSSIADEVVKRKLRQELMTGIEEDVVDPKDDRFEVTTSEFGQNKVMSILLRNSAPDYMMHKVGFKDNLFMYVNLFLGITITIFTFVWGVL